MSIIYKLLLAIAYYSIGVWLMGKYFMPWFSQFAANSITPAMGYFWSALLVPLVTMLFVALYFGVILGILRKLKGGDFYEGYD